MFNKDSDYALNRRSPNIVYRFADGSRLEIRLDDCPDFSFWKTLSDEDYRKEELLNLRITRRNISMYDLQDRDSEVEVVPPFDELLSDIETAMIILEHLTETQRRRYLLYAYDGKSTRQIAQAEGVSQRTIMDSLQESERRIKKFLKNTLSERQKNDV